MRNSAFSAPGNSAPPAIATRVYNLYGRFYDAFEMLFRRRLARAISSMPLHSGDRVLDIGIGTGLSLEYYPSYVQVTGIDLSAGMLRQAQRKLDAGTVRANTPRSDTVLLQGNALQLPFADRSFDALLLSHVITTVPDPQRCLAEAARVAREHATIAMVNHFRSANAALGAMETAIDPICRKLGWRCDLSLEQLLKEMGVEDLERRERTKGVLFRIVFLQKVQGKLRLVPVPEPPEREATLRPA